MRRASALQHRFVVDIPQHLETGVLYISLDYDTMVHVCCCGCGNEIVTPLSPTDWKLTYDGAAVSLHPSVGNWSQKCRSHYVIRGGKVMWASDWTDEKIAAGRARNYAAKQRRYGAITETPLTKE